MTSQLGKIDKSGWKIAKFGDVVIQCKEKCDPDTSGLDRYIAGDHMDTDDLKLRRWGVIGSGYLGPAFHIRFRPGQVLYGSRRTYLRKVALADFDGICANTTYVLQSKDKELLLPQFLSYLMQTKNFNEFSIKNSKGSVNPYINFSDLERFEFRLPPVEEQSRFLKLLINLEASSEEFRNLDLECSRLIEALFFHHVWADESLPRKEISSFAMINPVVGPLSETDPFIPMDALDVWSQEIDISRIEKKGARGGVKACGGDILMARITPCLENGKIAQVPFSIEKCGASTEFIVFRAKQGVNQQFLYHLITSSFFHMQAAGTMSGSTGRQRASAKDVSKILAPCIPLKKQNEVCELLDQILKTKDMVKNRLISMARLKSSVLGNIGE